MTAASCRCGATFSGRAEHCTACHHTFTGSSAGDKHRTGDHAISTGPNRRRCLTPDEMVVKGMTQNRHGYWGSERQKPSFWPSHLDSDGLADYDWGPVPLRQKEALESEFSEEAS